MIKCGKLFYDICTDRMDIEFDDGDCYGGLHCGECFDINVAGRWIPTRIEMKKDWYLVGLPNVQMEGSKVKIYS